MSVSVSVNGVSYTIPSTNEEGWGASVTAWIQSVSSNTLQKNGGTLTLTADANFGTTAGLVAKYYKSTSGNLSTTGVLRFANTDKIGFRNAGNSADLPLGVDTSNNLEYNAVDVALANNAAPTIVTFGYTSSAADTTTRYSAPGGPSAAAGTVEFAMPIPFTCKISNMRIYAQTAPAANCVYVARINGLDTTMTATIANGGTSASDLTHTSSFNAGDRLSVKHTMASATTCAANVTISFEITLV